MNKNVTAGVLIALAIGIYFTVTSGMIDSAKAVKSVNDQYVAALDNASQLIAVRDEITKKYNDISEADRARLDKMIPSTVDNIRLIIDLNNLALRHRFSLANLKASVPSNTAQNAAFASGKAVAPPVAAPGTLNLSATQSTITEPTLDKVQVGFTVTAGYDEFISFMRDLEADLRVMDVTHLSVTPNDAGTYDFGVQLQTYWLRQ